MCDQYNCPVYNQKKPLLCGLQAWDGVGVFTHPCSMALVEGGDMAQYDIRYFEVQVHSAWREC